MESVTFKVDEELKRKMEATKENWSAYLREAIRKRIEQEERRQAAEQLIADLKNNKRRAPSGFINSTIRESRDAA
jgi:hypothetical protein